MNFFFSWLVTFVFVNTTWVLFRAETWTDAVKVLQAMWGGSGFNLTVFEFFPNIHPGLYCCLVILTLIFAAVGKSSNYYMNNFQFNKKMLAFFVILFGVGIINIESNMEFLYFAF